MYICPHCVMTAIGSASLISGSAMTTVHTLKGRAPLAWESIKRPPSPFRMTTRHTIES